MAPSFSPIPHTRETQSWLPGLEEALGLGSPEAPLSSVLWLTVRTVTDTNISLMVVKNKGGGEEAARGDEPVASAHFGSGPLALD